MLQKCQGPAPFITFEGGEGVGKSTQIRMLARRIKAHGVEVESTLEPGATILGANLRRLVSDRRGDPPVPEAELCLYLADRAEHVQKLIAPALKRGRIVLCDRFVDSSEVYQGRARGLGVEKVRELNRWVCGEVWPSLTLLLDLDPEIGLQRVMERQGELGLDRLESEDMSFHRRVRRGFLEQADGEPERIKIIPAGHSSLEVADAVWELVEPLLKQWKCNAS